MLERFISLQDLIAVVALIGFTIKIYQLIRDSK